MAIATRTPVEIERDARAMLATLTLDGLLGAFEGTIDNADENIPQIRGWIMDELEARNASAFNAWLASTDQSPRAHYTA